MTKQEALRERLYLMGFEIVAESYSRDAGKPYVCMQVKYTGEKKVLSETEREICPKSANIVNKDLQKVYLEKKISIYKKIINGKKCGGNEEPRELHLARMIEEYLTKGE
jgi:tRNA A22 N-methylase